MRREAVLRAAHGDSTLAGHPGIDRTTAAVSHAFYWPGLHADVAHFVCTCKTCAASKSSNHQRLGTETYSAIPIQPFTSWAMDSIGLMPRSKDGNEWIGVEICCRFGLPQNLTMDNDVRFVSTSSYHSQANPAERTNRQVLEALRAAVATVVQYDEWD